MGARAGRARPVSFPHATCTRASRKNPKFLVCSQPQSVTPRLALGLPLPSVRSGRLSLSAHAHFGKGPVAFMRILRYHLGQSRGGAAVRRGGFLARQVSGWRCAPSSSQMGNWRDPLHPPRRWAARQFMERVLKPLSLLGLSLSPESGFCAESCQVGDRVGASGHPPAAGASGPGQPSSPETTVTHRQLCHGAVDKNQP